MLYLPNEGSLAEARQACNQNQLKKGKQGGVLKSRHSNPGTYARIRPSLWCLIGKQSLQACLSHLRGCGRSNGAWCTILPSQHLVEENMLFRFKFQGCICLVCGPPVRFEPTGCEGGQTTSQRSRSKKTCSSSCTMCHLDVVQILSSYGTLYSCCRSSSTFRFLIIPPANLTA